MFFGNRTQTLVKNNIRMINVKTRTSTVKNFDLWSQTDQKCASYVFQILHNLFAQLNTFRLRNFDRTKVLEQHTRKAY